MNKFTIIQGKSVLLLTKPIIESNNIKLLFTLTKNKKKKKIKK